MPKKLPFPIPDVTRTPQNTVAQILGVTRQAVAGWDCPRNTDKTYDLRRVVQWRCAMLESQALADDSKSTPELRRLRRLQGDKLAHEMAVGRREFVNAADVDHEWGVLLTRLRLRLVRLPQALMAVLPPATANTTIPIVKKEVKGALDDIIREYDKETKE